MKTIDKIIESQEAPKDKNVLWVKGDKLLSHVNGKWTLVGGGSASAKNQDKSVEIVENGVTEVTADSGYTGLGKVTINANVQGGESGKKIVYLNVVAVRDYFISAGYNDATLRARLSFGAISTKLGYDSGVYEILPFAYITDDLRKYTIAVAYLDDIKVHDAEGTQINSSQMIQQYKSVGAFEITEEEFYNLEA